MSKDIDFYFDFSSSYSYIGQHRLDALAKEFDLSVHWRPIALGAIFKARGHAPPTPDSAKGAYIWHDVERSAAEWGLPYHWPRPFPFNSIPAARVFYYLEASDADRALAWARAVFYASYGQGRDCSDPSLLAKIGDGIGADGEALVEATAQPEVKERLKAATDEAAGRGVFGTPTFFLDGEMYWGADRIDQMARTLRRG